MAGILLVFLVQRSAVAQDVALPADVRRQLDAVHTGWKLAAVLPEVESESRERTPRWPPNMILGDFDGNRQTDVAVLIEYPEPKLAGGRAVQLYAFLGDGKAFKRFVLEQPAPLDPRQFLHLMREAGTSDAVGVEYEAIGGHEWRYRNRKWQSKLAH